MENNTNSFFNNSKPSLSMSEQVTKTFGRDILFEKNNNLFNLFVDLYSKIDTCCEQTNRYCRGQNIEPCFIRAADRPQNYLQSRFAVATNGLRFFKESENQRNFAENKK